MAGRWSMERGWGGGWANTRLLNNAARRPVSGNNQRGNYRRSIEKNLAWIIISPLARSLGAKRGWRRLRRVEIGFHGMKTWGGAERGKKKEEDGVWGRGRGLELGGDKKDEAWWCGRGSKGRGLVEANSQRPTPGRYCIFIRWLRHSISFFLPSFVPPPKAVKLGRRVNDDAIIARFRQLLIIRLPVSDSIVRIFMGLYDRLSLFEDWFF